METPPRPVPDPPALPMRPPTVTRQHLVQRIADQTGLQKKSVQDVIDRFLAEMADELEKGHRIEFRDFGVFEIVERAPRRAQNPSTLERVDVPSRLQVKFKSGRRLADRVAKSKPYAPPPEPKATKPATPPRKKDSPF